MSLYSRLQRIEMLARERMKEIERKSQKGWRLVTIRDGVELTPYENSVLSFNKGTKGNGVGFRFINIRCQNSNAERNNTP